MRFIDRIGSPMWVIGKPINHSLSPVIHNAALRAAGLGHHYFALEVGCDELAEFLNVFENIKCPGANMTLPLKREIIKLIDTDNRSTAVERLGAANTLYWEDGSPAVDNTDLYGFKKLVEPWKKEIKNSPVLLLGAGGAARACLAGLDDFDCPEIILWNRTVERAYELQGKFSNSPIRVIEKNDFEKTAAEAVVVVNATSLGLKKADPSPFPRPAIQKSMIGIDLIYNRRTEFMLNFEGAGRAAEGGLKMLIHQAARGWELWFDREPDLRVMQDAALEQLNK